MFVCRNGDDYGIKLGEKVGESKKKNSLNFSNWGRGMFFSKYGAKSTLNACEKVHSCGIG